VTASPAMTGPPLQQSNGAFLVQGVAVRQADHLINLALRVLRDRRKDVREFLPLQAAAANAHADIKAGGHYGLIAFEGVAGVGVSVAG